MKKMKNIEMKSCEATTEYFFLFFTFLFLILTGIMVTIFNLLLQCFT